MEPNTTPRHERPVSQRVVEKVADAKSTSPLDLAPLFDRVDPDALDRIFSDGPGTTVRDQGRVSFPMAGCEVTVWADGTVEAEDLTAQAHDAVSDSTASAEPSD